MKPGAAKKILLLALAAVLLVGVAPIQRSLNRDRRDLGLTLVEPLENAPPVLAFTTVALGGFGFRWGAGARRGMWRGSRCSWPPRPGRM